MTPGETADSFIVAGRGTLHLGILIENMRREGFEFEIGPPKVITKEVKGKTCEPYEEAVVEVPEQYVGAVVELFAQRKGEMTDLQPSSETTQRLAFRIATRGLLGLRNALLTATRGMGIMNTVSDVCMGVGVYVWVWECMYGCGGVCVSKGELAVAVSRTPPSATD